MMQPLLKEIETLANRKIILMRELIILTIDRIKLIKGEAKAIAFVKKLVDKDPAWLYSNPGRDHVREAGEDVLKFLDKEKDFIASLLELHKVEKETYLKIDFWRTSFAELNIDAANIFSELKDLIARKTEKKTDAGIIWLILMCYNYSLREIHYAAPLEAALKENKLEELVYSRIYSVKRNSKNLGVNLGAENPLVRIFLRQKIGLQIAKMNELIERLKTHSTASGDHVTNLKIIEIPSSKRSYRVLGCSVHGESHSRKQIPNQDSILAMASGEGYGPPIILAVADGVSNAARSETGSRLAAETAIEILRKGIGRKADELNRTNLLRNLKEQIINGFKGRVFAHFQQNPLDAQVLQAYYSKLKTGGEIKKKVDEDLRNPYRAYATTLLAVLVTDEFILYLNVGDGRIVTVNGRQITTPIREPQIFEVQTESLGDSPDDIKIDVVASKPEFIFVSTDGLPDCYSRDGGNEWFIEFADEIRTNGVDNAINKLPGWLMPLARTNPAAKKDDVTIGAICNLKYK